MKIGIWCTSNICYNSLNYFLNCISKALNELGVDTEKFQILDEKALFSGYDAIIGINSSVPIDKLESGQYVFWVQ